MLLAMRVVYEGEGIKYDMSVGDGRMTIKWLGELIELIPCASPKTTCVNELLLLAVRRLPTYFHARFRGYSTQQYSSTVRVHNTYEHILFLGGCSLGGCSV